jgi:hypothetical protein
MHTVELDATRGMALMRPEVLIVLTAHPAIHLSCKIVKLTHAIILGLGRRSILVDNAIPGMHRHIFSLSYTAIVLIFITYSSRITHLSIIGVNNLNDVVFGLRLILLEPSFSSDRCRVRML